MFYIKDFQPVKKNKIFSATDKNSFSVILSKKSFEKTNSKYSLAVAAKPLIRFATIFGSQLIKYKKNKIVKLNIPSKLYSLLFLTFYITLAAVIIRPASWRYTSSDAPLNILTKTYGAVNIAEAIYSVFSIAILNSEYYVKLFNKLDGLDNHYGSSKLLFTRRRIISIVIIIMPILQELSTIWLRKFNWQNIGAHVSFLLIMLQGWILLFIVWSIFIKHIMLNEILIRRIENTMSKEKKMVIQDSISAAVIKVSMCNHMILRDSSKWITTKTKGSATC